MASVPSSGPSSVAGNLPTTAASPEMRAAGAAEGLSSHLKRREPEHHDIDPDGDVLLILKSPNAPFAIWDKQIMPQLSGVAEAASEDGVNRGGGGSTTNRGSLGEEGDRTDDKDEDGEYDSNGREIMFRVSSRHLVLASAFFRKALSGSWKEGAMTMTTSPSGSAPSSVHGWSDGAEGIMSPLDRHHSHHPSSSDRSPVAARSANLVPPHPVECSDWDPAALLILLNIIHGRNRQVPRNVNLETLAKIAVLADYYEAHEAAEVFGTLWISHLEKNYFMPTSCSRDLSLWICVSWVFKDADIFSRATYTAVMCNTGRIQTMNLPIPANVVDLIDHRRDQSIKLLFVGLDELRDGLLHGRRGCSFACQSMLLGALEKQLSSYNVFGGGPGDAFRGLNVPDALKIVRNMESPSIQTIGKKSHQGPRCQCSLLRFTATLLAELEAGVKGMELTDFGRK